MTNRLDLLCVAETEGLRVGAFPAAAAPLDPKGRAALAHLADEFKGYDAVFASPARAASETAEALGLAATPEPALRDCDFGRWARRTLAEIEAAEPEALSVWLRDPEAAPHDGESFADAANRVGEWMDALAEKSGRFLAITHAAALRGAIVHALGAPALSLLHIDISPLSRVQLSRLKGNWRFGGLTPVSPMR